MSHIFDLKPKHLTILFFVLILMHNVHVIRCRKLPADKRTLVAAGGNESPGQLEEVFDVGNQINVNYDEYPMVVPKRSSLYLDRLMVALHRALEKDRADQRKLDVFYGNNTIDTKIDNSDQGEEYNMYGGDDPSVLMDYDFKDLNSINRATGETLMTTNGFQRRTSLGTNAASLKQRLATPAANDMAGIIGRSVGGGGGRNSAIGTGSRKYWRCYFNAVTCF